MGEGLKCIEISKVCICCRVEDKMTKGFNRSEDCGKGRSEKQKVGLVSCTG